MTCPATGPAAMVATTASRMKTMKITTCLIGRQSLFTRSLMNTSAATRWPRAVRSRMPKQYARKASQTRRLSRIPTGKNVTTDAATAKHTIFTSASMCAGYLKTCGSWCQKGGGPLRAGAVDSVFAMFP